MTPSKIFILSDGSCLTVWANLQFDHIQPIGDHLNAHTLSKRFYLDHFIHIDSLFQNMSELSD